MDANLAPDLITRTAEGFGKFAGAFTMAHVPFLLLALVPALAWLYLMFRHQSENKFLTLLTFGWVCSR